MRNGDSMLVRDAFGPLHLRVGGRDMDAEPGKVERVEFAEGGDKATVAFITGDSFTGELADQRLELVLASGPKLVVHPSALRTISRVAASSATRGSGG